MLKQSSRTQQTQQPSTQQIRMLVQQIQMAVQAGYLNQQVIQRLTLDTFTKRSKKKKI